MSSISRGFQRWQVSFPLGCVARPLWVHGPAWFLVTVVLYTVRFRIGCELHRNRPIHSPSLALPSFFFFFLNMFVIDVNYSIYYSKNKTSVCGSLGEW